MGGSWLQCYVYTLCESDRNSIETISSETKFKFGDGQVHYCIPLNHYCEINSVMSKFNQERIILLSNNVGSKPVKEGRHVALKLHKQFSHPTSHKLVAYRWRC